MGPMTSGEEAFLERLIATGDRREDVIVPIGDDAAVLRPREGRDLVVAADAICEGTHFFPGTPPEAIGRKALAVNLSDFAAMAATPRFAFATACLPRGFDPRFADATTEGLRATARRYGVALCGGDTTTFDGPFVLSVTLVGDVERGRAVRRDGARPGDVLAVTGPLGASLRSGRHLRFEPRLDASAALATLGPPSAMMDVSDGLLLDLDRLARRSGVGADVDAARVPIHADVDDVAPDARLLSALSDGEDFELLFAAPPAIFERIAASWPLAAPPIAIGRATAEPGVRVFSNGALLALEKRGYEHR
jgi:thiamine-monophosphate kinase